MRYQPSLGEGDKNLWMHWQTTAEIFQLTSLWFKEIGYPRQGPRKACML